MKNLKIIFMNHPLKNNKQFIHVPNSTLIVFSLSYISSPLTSILILFPIDSNPLIPIIYIKSTISLGNSNSPIRIFG